MKPNWRGCECRSFAGILQLCQSNMNRSKMAVKGRFFISIAIGVSYFVGGLHAFASTEYLESEAVAQTEPSRPRVKTEKPTKASPAVSLGPKGHYDEVFRSARDHKGRKIGIVRPEYQDIVNVASELSESEIRAGELATQSDFRGDNVLSLVPRIVLDSDYDGILKPGIDQRGRALRAFLQDFHANNGKPFFVQDGHMKQEDLDRIVARSTETWSVGRINPSQISLMYGPDIIRDRMGVFRVVEDNTGFLGGFGDLKLALESLYRNVEYPDLHERDPMDFYRNLMKRYKDRANPKSGEVVMLMIPPYADNEDPRLRQILKSIGIEVVTPYSKTKLEFDERRKAWLRPSDGGARRKVGFLILNGEHWWLDMRHEDMHQVAVYEYSKLVLDELNEYRKQLEAEGKVAFKYDEKGRKRKNRDGNKSKKLYDDIRYLETIQREFGIKGLSAGKLRRLLKNFLVFLQVTDDMTGLPKTQNLKAALRDLNQISELKEWEFRSYSGLIDALLEGKVASNYTPGTNFVNDKAFYPYVEDIVRYYLKEEPILRNIETVDPRVVRNGQPAEFDLEMAKRVAKNQAEWVIKLVDGRGGKGIWVGPKVSEEEFRQGLKAVKADPGKYKYQRYTALSTVGQYIVDIRIHSDLPPSGSLFVSDTAWGRGLPVAGDGRVNLSAQGRETTVIVRSAQKFCESLFVPSVLPSSMVYRRK